MTPSGPFRGLCFGTVIRLGWDQQKHAQPEGKMSEPEQVTQQHGRPRPGGKAGPRRMPAGCGAERNGPRLGNTGALPTALRTGVR